jgi:hypothetical protein
MRRFKTWPQAVATLPVSKAPTRINRQDHQDTKRKNFVPFVIFVVKKVPFAAFAFFARSSPQFALFVPWCLGGEKGECSLQ